MVRHYPHPHNSDSNPAAADQLATYCNCLFGAEPSGFVEVRYRRDEGRSGMGQMWLPADQPQIGFGPIMGIGRRTDLYVGVLPRIERRGRRDSIGRGFVLYVDCDTPRSIEALARFAPAPSLIVGSGTGRHAYWSLAVPVSPDVIERANRKLAQALGADSRATDAARILRPPGTFNHKRDEPRPVELLSVEFETYTVAEVVGKLPEIQEPRAISRLAARITRSADDQLVSALLAIPPAKYVERLTGSQVGRDGKATCPFHSGGNERTPSLHAYPTAEEGWTCFGCEPPGGRGALGGDLFAFASLLWGIENRGRGFFELRDRLAAELLAEAARAA